MAHYNVQMEIAGPTAIWTRPDTGDAPTSYAAPTFSAVKGIFESVLWLQSAEVCPTRVEICARWCTTPTPPTTAARFGRAIR